MIAPGYLVNAAGGALLVAFGIWVATLRPRTPTTLAFALFAASFGLAFTTQNLARPGLPVAWNVAATVLSATAAVPAAAAALFVVHRAPGPRAGRLAAVPLAAAAVGFVLLVPIALQVPPENLRVGSDAEVAAIRILLILVGGLDLAMLAATGYAAVRAAAAEERATASQLALLAGSIVVFPAFFAGALTTDADGGLFGLISSTLVALVAVLWLRASAVGPAPGPARNVALAGLGALLVGLVAVTLAGTQAALDATGAYGVVRAVTVLLLAYAVLRHHLLGLDVKVRWTISKSALAAVFVTVFFVASEAAQQFLGETLGSAYIGILATGALVFAIAPLQRLADRLAARAVPPAPATAIADATRRRIYRAAYEAARVDGVVTERERDVLAALQEELGLGAREAREIERGAVAAESGQPFAEADAPSTIR